jgi:hypothetical protein
MLAFHCHRRGTSASSLSLCFLLAFAVAAVAAVAEHENTHATPGLGQVLQDRLGLVLLDPLGHHVENIVHDGGTELEIKVRLDTLLGDGLGDSVVQRRRS